MNNSKIKKSKGKGIKYSGTINLSNYCIFMNDNDDEIVIINNKYKSIFDKEIQEQCKPIVNLIPVENTDCSYEVITEECK